MKAKLNIICAVTNDLIQDQRMDRICRSLMEMDYKVSLWGRKKPGSLSLQDKAYRQRRFAVFFHKGPAFYLEYNIRFCLAAISARPHIIYAVDTDTLPGAWLASRITGAKLVFDAHEYFTEVPELQHSPFKRKIWTLVERFTIPAAHVHVTVSNSLANIFAERYGRKFHVIRNVPEKSSKTQVAKIYDKPYILYQGVLNEGRGLEAIIEAMALLPDIELRIVGWGDIGNALQEQAKKSIAAKRIHFMGWLTPPELQQVTAGAVLGLNILDGKSKSYQYSLANKFFDYMHAGIPSLNMDFPEYRYIIDQFLVGFLVNTLDPESLAQYISEIIVDEAQLQVMRTVCEEASQVFCWEQESLILKELFQSFIQ